MPAPVILFAFNRPDHTRRTLASLRANHLAPHSDLIVFADGPRNADDEALVTQVAALLEGLTGFASVTVHRQQANRGLAPSVIAGVSEVIARSGRVIVVEDDLELSPHFLDYMNQALERYQHDPRVFSVGGYSPPIAIPDTYHHDSYLSWRCCTWGWATWLDRWQRADWEVRDYARFARDAEAVARFNRNGDDMSQILRLQMEGRISSWGIRWDYAHFVHDACCFRPCRSIVGNTGNDGSGVHCAPTDKFDLRINDQADFAWPAPGELVPERILNQRFATFYDGRARPEDGGDAVPGLPVRPRSAQGWRARLVRVLAQLGWRP